MTDTYDLRNCSRKDLTDSQLLGRIQMLNRENKHMERERIVNDKVIHALLEERRLRNLK